MTYDKDRGVRRACDEARCFQQAKLKQQIFDAAWSRADDAPRGVSLGLGASISTNISPMNLANNGRPIDFAISSDLLRAHRGPRPGEDEDT